MAPPKFAQRAAGELGQRKLATANPARGRRHQLRWLPGVSVLGAGRRVAYERKSMQSVI